MSITFTQSLGFGLTVGAKVGVDFRNQSTGIYLPSTVSQNAAGKSATLLIFNESGYGFTFTMGAASSQSKPLPAGGWRSISLPPDVQQLTLTVAYVLPNAPASVLIIEYCQSGETPDAIGFLGNSPVGGIVSSPSSPANNIEQDLFTPFVLTGMLTAKDGNVANQLDMTSGIAFLTQADASLGRVAPLAQNFLTTTPNTTYFLDLNPDGSFSFATTHSGVSNHLTIASCTTDGSGNILIVTDARQLNTTLFAAGNTNALSLFAGGLISWLGAGVNRWEFSTPQAGPSNWFEIFVWNGASIVQALGVGDAWVNGNPNTAFGSNGGIQRLAQQGTAGGLGVPAVVALPTRQHITTNAATTVVNVTPSSTGVWEISVYGFCAGASRGIISVTLGFNDPDNGVTSTVLFGEDAGTPGSFVLFSAHTMNVTNSTAHIPTYPFTHAGGSAITLVWQNTAASISDFVTVILKRVG